MKTKEKIVSCFAFGEHWLELPEYVGYCPSDGRSWRSLKEDFYSFFYFL
jgi:hypothetical protein